MRLCRFRSTRRQGQEGGEVEYRVGHTRGVFCSEIGQFGEGGIFGGRCRIGRGWGRGQGLGFRALAEKEVGLNFFSGAGDAC